MSRPPRALTALVGPAVAVALIGGGAGLAVATDQKPKPGEPSVQLPDANSALACVVPGDSAGLDQILLNAGSPMAGLGTVLVEVSSQSGIDPRLIVAIAAHETMLGTYGPAAAINNPFGLGPGMVFPSEGDAVRYAVSTLARYYLPEGRDTIAEIGAKWAPVGAKNDPTGLNGNWTAGVSSYYAALGGDPSRRPLLADQDATPSCAGGGGLGNGGIVPPVAPEPPSVGDGPPVVTVWGGNAPVGAQSATLTGFAFPLAVREGGEARYADATCSVQDLCGVGVATAAMTHVVAAVEGRLVAGTATERAQGVAFWIVREDGNRVGYGPLASYAPGVSHGARVAMGQPLGRSTGSLVIAWTRRGTSMDPFPMLAATRPPDAEPSPAT
ncbi:MAG: glucosaminidase domain-containing protein [Thermoleophilia bacterium]|nr:glucosaminidase domain-containing protein [Thermoleophilia bacterium]